MLLWTWDLRRLIVYGSAVFWYPSGHLQMWVWTTTTTTNSKQQHQQHHNKQLKPFVKNRLSFLICDPLGSKAPNEMFSRSKNSGSSSSVLGSVRGQKIHLIFTIRGPYADIRSDDRPYAGSWNDAGKQSVLMKCFDYAEVIQPKRSSTTVKISKYSGGVQDNSRWGRE